MADLRAHSSTSNIVRFTLKNSTTGQGITGLSSASSGLIISTITDNEATAATYTVAGSTIETITTLGTYATPTATKCRFKEVDATNHKGLYEFQFADARFSVASAKRLVISVAGATNLQDQDYEIQLTGMDVYDSVRGGMTALPNAAADAAGGLPISDAGGLDLDARLDAAVSSRLAPTVSGRTLDVTTTGEAGIDLDNTAGALAKGTEITGFNDLSAAQVNTECDTALTDYGALKPTVSGRTLDVNLTGEAGIDLDNTSGTLAKGTDITGFNDVAATDIVSSGAITTSGGLASVNVKQINDNAASAIRLALSAGQITPITVDTAIFTPTVTQFECDDITEATADHYNGRIVLWTTGALTGQITSVEDYALSGSNGRFTVTGMTEAPANNDTGILL